MARILDDRDKELLIEDVSEIFNTQLVGYVDDQLKNKVDKINGKSLSTNDYTTAEKNKLAGIAVGANKYVHPTYTVKDNGLYKITVDNTGHVSEVISVVKSDIVALGIPEQDTIYTLPVATAQSLGGIKVGSGLIIDKDGFLNTTSEGGVATSIDWDNVNNKPTTLSGYGIESISKSDLSSGVQASLDKADSAIQSIPSAIKNPNSLTFTGAVSASYDGSAAITINIPTGNDKTLKINDDGVVYFG